MGKSVRVDHKVKGEAVASFDVADGVATVGSHTCDTLNLAFTSGMYAFLSETHPNERAEFSATVVKSGSKWAVSILVRYVDGGVFQSLRWVAGEFGGTRGTALYRAFLAFGEAAREGGSVRAQLESERAERYAVARAILAPVENGSDVRESGSAGEVDAFVSALFAPELGTDGKPWEPGDDPARRVAGDPVVYVAPATGDVCPSTGLTYSAMRDAVAAHRAAGREFSVDVSKLPDPRAPRQWDAPADGTADDFRGCEGAGPVDVINPERTHGKCPACRTYIPLTDSEDENRIGSHFEYGVSAPANRKRLSSRTLDTVEHGSVPGSPMDANARRIAETQCKGSRKVITDASGGTVRCPDAECGRPVELKSRRKGDDVVWFVPDHTRPGESFRRSGKAGRDERSVTPRGTGADAGKGARDHGSVDGSATTGKHNMPPVQPKNGWAAVAGTWSLPAMVSPGIDPGAAGKWCPVCQDNVDTAHRGKSRTWRRKHSKAVAKFRAERKAERDARTAADIAAGLAIPASERRALRKAASIGSSAEGTQASTGRVIHAACVRG